MLAANITTTHRGAARSISYYKQYQGTKNFKKKLTEWNFLKNENFKYLLRSLANHLGGFVSPWKSIGILPTWVPKWLGNLLGT